MEALHIGTIGQVWLTSEEAKALLKEGFQIYSGGRRLKDGLYMNHQGYYCLYNQDKADLSGYWHVARF